MDLAAFLAPGWWHSSAEGCPRAADQWVFTGMGCGSEIFHEMAQRTLKGSCCHCGDLTICYTCAAVGDVQRFPTASFIPCCSNRELSLEQGIPQPCQHGQCHGDDLESPREGLITRDRLLIKELGSVSGNCPTGLFQRLLQWLVFHLGNEALRFRSNLAS